jgi:hypothetical protein
MLDIFRSFLYAANQSRILDRSCDTLAHHGRAGRDRRDPHPNGIRTARKVSAEISGKKGLTMDIILVPGLWLDGSSWDRVTPVLETAGHQVRPITLPGLESTDADRSSVTLRDQIDAVVAAIDACE